MDMRASGNILAAPILRIFADRFTCRDGAVGFVVVHDRLRDNSLDREAGLSVFVAVTLSLQAGLFLP